MVTFVRTSHSLGLANIVGIMINLSTSSYPLESNSQSDSLSISDSLTYRWTKSEPQDVRRQPDTRDFWTDVVRALYLILTGCLPMMNGVSEVNVITRVAIVNSHILTNRRRYL